MNDRMSNLDLLKKTLSTGRFKYRFFMLLLLGVIGSFFAGIGIGLFVPVLEFLSKGNLDNAPGFISGALRFFNITPSLGFFVTVIFLCILMQSALELVRRIMSARLRDDLTQYLRDTAFSNLLDVSFRFYHNRKVGELTSIIGDEALRGGVALFVLNDIIAAVIVALILTGLLFLISWQATVCAAVMSLISFFSIKGLVAKSEKLGQIKGDYKSLITNFCIENLSSMFLITSFNCQGRVRSRFFQLTADIKKNLRTLSRHNALIEFFNSLIKITSICVLIFFFYSVLHLSIGYLGTILLVISVLVPKINLINVQLQTYFENIAGLRSIYMLGQKGDKLYIRNGSIAAQPLKKGIEFHNVSFEYLAGVPVLSDINLTFDRGKVTAIIGGSGSGKSTLISLIPRFYDVKTGVIRIDGRDLCDLDVFSWRNHLGFISQETFIYNDTIRNNLLLARPEASGVDISQAVRLAHLDEFINGLENGLDTNVGDRGIKLSGGQKQRIAIARVFLKNPDILILDEATSSLDTISETLIQQSMDELSKNRTVIVIAHRLTTVRNADKIIVLEDGRIVEQGVPSDLLAKDSQYAKYLFAADSPANRGNGEEIA
jgi:subfamily B ATP-binding cassette protein MsbA